MIPNLEREANRLHWMFKGSLLEEGISIFELEQQYNRYFKKGWGVVDPSNSLIGFDEAWEERLGQRAKRYTFGQEIKPMTDEERQRSVERSKANRK